MNNTHYIDTILEFVSMNFRSFVKILAAPILGLFLLNGCTGEIDGFTDGGSQSYQLGSGTGGSFTAGGLTLSSTTVAASGTVNVSVNIVDQFNDPITTSVTVTFSSTCEASALATFSPASVITTSGIASTIYTNAGCTTTDQITATATNIDGTDITATGSITFSAAGVILRIGTDAGAVFNDGVLTLGASSVITGGNTTLTVDIADVTGAPYLTQVAVTFESTCAANSQATITSPTVSTSTGVAFTTYIDNGCLFNDSITATLKTGGLEPTASALLSIVPIRIGSGSGATFTNGAVNIVTTPITAGESTGVSINVVDGSDALILTPYTVTFTSTCAVGSFTNSVITAINGTASTTYLDNGCPGADFITASLDNRTSAPNPEAYGQVNINPLNIGSGTGVSFTAGALTISLPNIASTGSTAVSANIVDVNGTLITTPYTVNFKSTCSGLATPRASFDNTSPITVGGTATATYTAAGCSGDDLITATATPFPGVNLIATGTVTVAAPSAGSIQFTSNSHSIIALLGTGITTGLPETSIVTFTVVDGLGNPLSGQQVDFLLNTSVGGITLQSPVDVSDVNGEVQAIVQSGNVASSVRVTATLTSNAAITTQSSAIVISTGLPDQDSMTLSAETYNPQAWNHNLVEVAITAQVADRFNNRIQDGTSISFTTELGSIGGSCQTVDGACSVTWISQNPRGTIANAGRSTILATVIGEESFRDANGNGVYDDADGALTAFDDLEEAFVDYNEDDTRSSDEPYTDFNSNGIHDAKNNRFDGVQCTHSTLCSPNKTLSVRQSIVLIMAEDSPWIYKITDGGAAPTTVCDDATATTCGANYPTAFTTLPVTGSIPFVFTIRGAGLGQILPAGTKIDFGVTNGKIEAGASHTVVNTSVNVATVATSADDYRVDISGDGSASVGVLTIKVTLPDGLEVNFSPITITDQDTP